MELVDRRSVSTRVSHGTTGYEMGKLLVVGGAVLMRRSACS